MLIPSRPDHISRRIAFACAVMAVVSFFAWQIGRFFSPPKLLIAGPAETLLREQSVFVFTGHLRESARLTINGEIVYVEPETYEFQETVPLRPGENTFVFRVEDRLGRVREVVRRVYRF